MQKINKKQKQMENQWTDINSTKSEQGNTESQNHCSKIKKKILFLRPHEH